MYELSWYLPYLNRGTDTSSTLAPTSASLSAASRTVESTSCSDTSRSNPSFSIPIVIPFKLSEFICLRVNTSTIPLIPFLNRPRIIPNTVHGLFYNNKCRQPKDQPIVCLNILSVRMDTALVLLIEMCCHSLQAIEQFSCLPL